MGVSSENHDVGKYIQHKNYKSCVITITYNLFSISFLYCVYVIDAITYILLMITFLKILLSTVNECNTIYNT